MVAQLKPPARLQPLLPPAIPPMDRHVTYGYRRNKSYEWQLTDLGVEAAAQAQRILLSYVLQIETRGDLAERYSMALTQVQATIRGAAHQWFTAPVRERLIALGIGDWTMHRSARRDHEIRRAMSRLAAEASAMLASPNAYSQQHRDQLRTDLWLLSGAWWEPAA